MMKTDYEEFDAKVDRFLCRKMTPEEEQAFQAELASSPELMERARVTAFMIREMEVLHREQEDQMADEMEQARQWCASSREKDKLAAFLSDKDGSEPPLPEASGQASADVSGNPLPKPNRRLWPRVLAVAAAACVVGVFVWVGMRVHTTRQYRELATQELYQTYPCESAEDFAHFRGEPLRQGALLSQLYRNVQSGRDLENTVRQLEQLYAEACRESSELYELRDDLAWNLAFAYLKSGDGKKAISVLEEMLKRNEPYPSLADPVHRLLDKLYRI